MHWPLRVLGLLFAAAITSTAAHTARAEPRPADTCARASFRAVIDVGHTAKAPGAKSARGLPEFLRNERQAVA